MLPAMQFKQPSGTGTTRLSNSHKQFTQEIMFIMFKVAQSLVASYETIKK